MHIANSRNREANIILTVSLGFWTEAVSRVWFSHVQVKRTSRGASDVSVLVLEVCNVPLVLLLVAFSWSLQYLTFEKRFQGRTFEAYEGFSQILVFTCVALLWTRNFKTLKEIYGFIVHVKVTHVRR